MSLIDTTFIREYHGFSPTQPGDAFMQNQHFNAEQKLRTWVGDTRYEWAEQLQPGADPADLRKATAFKNAEAELTMYFAVPKLNVKVGDQGLIQSSESTQFGKSVFKIATPGQIEQIRKKYFNDAWGLVRMFISQQPGVLPVRPKS